LSSRDEGVTWSAVEHLPAGLYGPIRAKPLVRPGGAIVSGTSVESYRSWAAWIERSTDNGRTCTRYGPITVPALADGRFVMIYNHTTQGRTPLNLAVSRDGDLHVTCTWQRNKIRYVRWPLAKMP
jgi:hypothetical protein